jgi:hypothetical protein
MKKVILTVLAVFLFTAAVAVGPVWSQGKADFSLNLGVQTNVWSGTSFDNAWFTLDARVGFGLGRSFEISPEVMFVVDDSFDFDLTFLYPGVMLNYTPGNLFVGAGIILPVAMGGGETDTGNLAPKVNIGYRAGNLMFTLYAFTWTESGLDFLDMNFVGVTLGYRF